MKNRDLSKAIGNIDLKYVEEAENYTAKRMTLTKVISLAACIAVLVTAILVTFIFNREDTKTDAPVVTTPLEIENNGSENNSEKSPVKIVYCSSETAEEIRQAALENGVEIRDSSLLEADGDKVVGGANANAEIPAKLYYTINGVDYTFIFKGVYETSSASSEIDSIKSHGYFARYKTDDDSDIVCTLDYYYETGRVRVISLDESKSKTLESGLTLEDVSVLAEKDMKTYIGENYADIYILSESSLCEISHREESYFVVEYTKYIGGYRTDERVILYYNLKGSLIRFSTVNLGRFDSVTHLDYDTIYKSEIEALNLINGCKIKDKYLVVDNNGDIFIYMSYFCPQEYDDTIYEILPCELFYRIK